MAQLFVYGTYAVAFIGVSSTIILFIHFASRRKAEQINNQLGYEQKI